MNTTTNITSIDALVLDVLDAEASQAFASAAFALDDRVRFRSSPEAPTGFRGFTLSLVVSQPANVDAFVEAAQAAGARTVKVPAKSLWGYGAVLEAPDGIIWKLATSTKKNTAAASRTFDDLVVLLGPADVAATKTFYTEHGLAVAKSFGKKYVEFDPAAGRVNLALYGRRGLLKDAGVSADDPGIHGLSFVSPSGPFTDPDGVSWEPVG